MDDAVLATMARWPDVPHVYGWLSLDRRGRWRIKGEAVSNPALIQFINRNYDVDERGCWYFQNGPQRVFVALEYTPWILRLASPERLETHTGIALDTPRQAYLDEDGNLLLDTGRGLGLVCDRDLATMVDHVRQPDGAPVDADTLEQFMANRGPLLHLQGFGPPLALTPITRPAAARIGGHVTDPAP